MLVNIETSRRSLKLEAKVNFKAMLVAYKEGAELYVVKALATLRVLVNPKIEVVKAVLEVEFLAIGAELEVKLMVTEARLSICYEERMIAITAVTQPYWLASTLLQLAS